MKIKIILLSFYLVLLCFWLLLAITNKFHMPQIMPNKLIFFIVIGLTILCPLYGWLAFSKQKTKFQLIMATITSILAGIYLWQLLV